MKGEGMGDARTGGTASPGPVTPGGKSTGFELGVRHFF